MPAGATDCPEPAVPSRVEGEAFYSDVQGSIVDQDKLRRDMAMIAPLRAFVTEASSRADSPDRDDRACAARLMESWARGGALLEAPRSFEATRERQRFAIALNIVALKLHAAGVDSAPLLDWLGRLNHAVIADFDKRNQVDNLFVWSGVAASSYALLAHDDDAARYAAMVWTQAIGLIRPDGTIASELARGRRALVYHAYELSALLVLRAFREAAGDHANPEDIAALRRLSDRVVEALCDPADMARAAGSPQQEPVPPTELSPIVAFAGDLGDARIRRCGSPDIPAADPVMGGNLMRTAALLANRSYRRAEQ
ncbi:MAG TPA: alginate lyase family protein [Stellaceae bacterium]|nr:alginate lyase family protein [Stellaceae bacterium]